MRCHPRKCLVILAHAGIQSNYFPLGSLKQMKQSIRLGPRVREDDKLLLNRKRGPTAASGFGIGILNDKAFALNIAFIVDGGPY